MILIPAVSIGNVPQLAFDLLIHTYGFTLEKSLDDECMYPIAGPLDYSSTKELGIATPIQLYTLNDIKLIQLRSPPLPNCREKFLTSLAKSLDSDSVIVAGSANAGMRLETLESPKLVWCNAHSIPEGIQETGAFIDAVEKFKAEGLLLYTYEGDNAQNAADVATALAEKLKLEQKPLTQPISWSRLYGKDVPVSVEEGIYA